VVAVALEAHGMEESVWREAVMKPIPISAAKTIADYYGYDQVIIIARAIDQGERTIQAYSHVA
jgi:hypothetical protein